MKLRTWRDFPSGHLHFPSVTAGSRRHVHWLVSRKTIDVSRRDTKVKSPFFGHSRYSQETQEDGDLFEQVNRRGIFVHQL
jgi:hypothetical protein